ncbi:alpha-amylase family glycosyl hydrolase [Tenacibaculum geojense]|uniref:Alpha-amylase family glycosyl hydrolase n=1 Tax=Tenacibaculum geojense TaxID=915352 RepID=A0ABW3JQM0_9FLAO
MKKIILLIVSLICSNILFAQQQNATFEVNPSTFNEDDEITITVSNINPSTWGVTDLYLWAWSFDINDANTMDSPTNGSWTNSNEAQKLTNNGNGTYSFTFTPTTFYNRTGIGSIGMLVKAKDGSGDKKTQDQIFEVGVFQLNLTSPTNNVTIINANENVNITATSTINADFNLLANGSSVHTVSNSNNYSFTVNPSETTNYTLQANDGTNTLSEEFQIVVRPIVTEESLPTGLLDGINFDENDATKATLVLYAPNKEFVHVIGDFNNWTIDDMYLMKKDVANDRFWIELTGLTPQQNHLYQYLIDASIRVADPYSTLILTESNDQYINNTTYPNLPDYPTGNTNHAVTVLKTGETSFNWEIINFTKPNKKDLVIYELLIRDFDELHSFDAITARLNYLEELGINAIELLPVSEFDGNESWGYNPSFHMALDKYYGTKEAFKTFIDECHKRGIAVILDVVYNHATGQNPFYRMWNTDNGGYGGQAAANSPFFNQTPTHTYNVFNDFNHSQQATKDYVKRTAQYWINEFKIDGFRWDLTKGFTQNCTENDESCTGAYQADRVAILKEYADYQWELDDTSYVIFEHLGSNTEETEWANYRLDEGKGIMLWSNLNGNYNEATMGYHENGKSDFSWIDYKNRGWTYPSNVAYMESHDEERLMFKNIEFGNSNASYDATELATALERLHTAGAFYFTIPGPKMIWQFGELGYDVSIEFNGRTGNKPIRWNYFDEPNRKAVYDIWATLIALKKQESIFKTSDFIINANNINGLKTIHLTNDDTSDDLQYVTIIGNFGITTQSIDPDFQAVGTWYDLLDNNSSIQVTNTNETISLQPGEFKIYANSQVVLSNEDFVFNNVNLVMYPNPASGLLYFTDEVSNLKVYDITGKEVITFNNHYDKNHAFDIKNLAKGIYIIKGKSLNKSFSKKLFVR